LGRVNDGWRLAVVNEDSSNWSVAGP